METHQYSDTIKHCLIQFEENVNLQFKNKALLFNALTHSSYAKQHRSKGYQDNEKLEFFGDAILKFITSEYLLLKFPDKSEGKLTKIRAHIISDQVLAKIAKNLHLNNYIFVSNSEKKTGGSLKKSILSNTFEALIGAIYLDQGIESTRSFLLLMFDTNQDLLFNKEASRDHKTELQEILQKQGLPVPDYAISAEEGPAHEKLFFITVKFSLEGVPHEFTGKGTSKKAAEQDAAKKALLKTISF